MALLQSTKRKTYDAGCVTRLALLEGILHSQTCMATDAPYKEASDLELLELEPETITKRPPMFKVVMLNDDYTPMEFVVGILCGIFRLPHEDAMQIMLNIHHQGKGICGIFTRDVAETKIELVLQCAREEGHPLQCTLEQESRFG